MKLSDIFVEHLGGIGTLVVICPLSMHINVRYICTYIPSASGEFAKATFYVYIYIYIHIYKKYENAVVAVRSNKLIYIN